MDNHGYDDPEEKPKNNNFVKDPSISDGTCDPEWATGGPGLRPPDYTECVGSESKAKENEVELQERRNRKQEEAVPKKKLSTQINRARKRTKTTLQSNRVTQPFCPPSGEVATTLTLVLTIIA